MTEQIYMNVHTGSTGTRDEWDYEDEDGHVVNAVDRGEVVPINPGGTRPCPVCQGQKYIQAFADNNGICPRCGGSKVVDAD